MHKYPGRCVLTYDHKYLEQNYDSSNFEVSCIPLVASKNGNHDLIKHKVRPRNLQPNIRSNGSITTELYIDCDKYPVKLKMDDKSFTQDTKANQFHNKTGTKLKRTNRELYRLDKGDTIETVQSKLSVIMRHKIMPCVSSLLKRVNNSIKHVSLIKENRVENTYADNCCQHGGNSEPRWRNKKQYVVRSVYNTRTTKTKSTQEPSQHLDRKKYKTQYANKLTSSESESQTMVARDDKRHRIKKFRKSLKAEILKEHKKYHQNRYMKTELNQYHAKNQASYNVFTTSFQSRTKCLQYPEQNCCYELPDSSSSFWEFLYDKTDKMHRTQTLGTLKPLCRDTSSKQLQCFQSFNCNRECVNEPIVPKQTCGIVPSCKDWCNNMEPQKSQNVRPPCVCKPKQPSSQQNSNERILGTCSNHSVSCGDIMTPKASHMSLKQGGQSTNKVICDCNNCYRKQQQSSNVSGDTLKLAKSPPQTKQKPKAKNKVICDCNEYYKKQLQKSGAPYDSTVISPKVSPIPAKQNAPSTTCSCPKKQQSSSSNSTKSMPARDSLMLMKKQKSDCKCQENKKKQHDSNISKGMQFSQEFQHQNKSREKGSKCRADHNEVTASLASKYNGEILCIHNPPCILINGCLNIPPEKKCNQSDHQTTLWPVAEEQNLSFYNYKPKNYEKSCQYHVATVTKDQSADYRAEKKIQSVCHHTPPCEIVRGCYRPTYDENLQNSCIHVPMCQKVPECAIGKREAEGCKHRPKCRNIPICSKNFIVLTAKETIGTQVKTEKNESLVCRHEPPCIMIPKCLGRSLCDCYMDVIPGCPHLPLCELIPACCRKPMKETVSVSSQYPNSCRIV